MIIHKLKLLAIISATLVLSACDVYDDFLNAIDKTKMSEGCRHFDFTHQHSLKFLKMYEQGSKSLDPYTALIFRLEHSADGNKEQSVGEEIKKLYQISLEVILSNRLTDNKDAKDFCIKNEIWRKF